MPTEIKTDIYQPMVLIEDGGCVYQNTSPTISIPFSVSPTSITSGDSLTNITGGCTDIEDGAITPTYFYSATDYPLPNVNESNLLALTTSLTLSNLGSQPLNLYAYMKCEDSEGAITWSKTNFTVNPVTDTNPTISVPLSVTPTSITSGSTLTSISGGCTDTEDGAITPTYFYSANDYPLPVANEGLLFGFSINIIYTTTATTTFYVYMKCEDTDGNIIWDKNSFEVTAPTTTFNNVAQSQSFSRNNCPAGHTTTPVTYTVAAGTYQSMASQAAADQLATDDINLNGQNYANTNGVCTPPLFLYDAVLEVTNCADGNGTNTLANGTGDAIGDTFVIQGTTTPFNGGNNWYRLTFGGVNQFYADYTALGFSTFIVQIDTNGEITAKTNC